MIQQLGLLLLENEYGRDTKLGIRDRPAPLFRHSHSFPPAGIAGYATQDSPHDLSRILDNYTQELLLT
jgi:hypothetical protein